MGGGGKQGKFRRGGEATTPAGGPPASPPYPIRSSGSAGATSTLNDPKSQRHPSSPTPLCNKHTLARVTSSAWCPVLFPWCFVARTWAALLALVGYPTYRNLYTRDKRTTWFALLEPLVFSSTGGGGGVEWGRKLAGNLATGPLTGTPSHPTKNLYLGKPVAESGIRVFNQKFHNSPINFQWSGGLPFNASQCYNKQVSRDEA